MMIPWAWMVASVGFFALTNLVVVCDMMAMITGCVKPW